MKINVITYTVKVTKRKRIINLHIVFLTNCIIDTTVDCQSPCLMFIDWSIHSSIARFYSTLYIEVTGKKKAFFFCQTKIIHRIYSASFTAITLTGVIRSLVLVYTGSKTYLAFSYAIYAMSCYSTSL